MMGYLEKLEFSKDWTDAEDFPTYEPDESQVRADLQLLHNEAKAAINALVDKLESAEFASHLAVSAEGMTATNLAAALAEILATAKAAQAGTIVDGTVTEAKLAAALVQKINSIDVTYSMNAPTANETPETGYQLGKLWLKPEFSIANLASDYALASGADWTGENVTKEASGGKLVCSGTGDSQYGTAKAEFTVPAGHTVRVWLTAEEAAGTVRVAEGVSRNNGIYADERNAARAGCDGGRGWKDHDPGEGRLVEHGDGGGRKVHDHGVHGGGQGGIDAAGVYRADGWEPRRAGRSKGTVRRGEDAARTLWPADGGRLEAAGAG